MRIFFSQSISAVDLTDTPKGRISDLFRTRTIRLISIVLYIIWFSVYLVYYGLVLNLSNIGGDVYVNSIISGMLLSIFGKIRTVLWKNSITLIARIKGWVKIWCKFLYVRGFLDCNLEEKRLLRFSFCGLCTQQIRSNVRGNKMKFSIL